MVKEGEFEKIGRKIGQASFGASGIEKDMNELTKKLKKLKICLLEDWLEEDREIVCVQGACPAKKPKKTKG